MSGFYSRLGFEVPSVESQMAYRFVRAITSVARSLYWQERVKAKAAEGLEPVRLAKDFLYWRRIKK